MIIAGIAWAFYTILGKNSKDPIHHSADNFFKTIFFLIIVFLFFIDDIQITYYGIFLAILSGGIASGLGYALWYYILKNMNLITASIVQLLVPIIAIFLGILFLDEKLTFTLTISSIFILGGIYLTIYKKS